MELTLASFLNTPWGMAVFILADIAVFLAIVALNYRWFFKRFFDILFSAVFLAVFSPFFLIFLAVSAIYNRVVNAYPALFEKLVFCGKKGKAFAMTVFATERVLHDAEGGLLPEEERMTKFGKFVKGCGIKYYPLLACVFMGKMSFVGPRPLTLADAAAVSEEDKVRFSVRPGLVNSLARYGGEKLTYDDMFEEDAEYVAHINFFRDISFFMTRFAQKVRGDKVNYLGEVSEKSYLEVLLADGKIAPEEAEAFRADAAAREARRDAARNERERFERRNLFR